MLSHSDGLGFTQTLEDLDWSSCQSSSPASDSVSAYSSFNFLGPSSDYRSLWLSPGIYGPQQHQHQQHREPFVDSYFSLEFPSEPIHSQENSYSHHNTTDDSLYYQFGKTPASDHLDQSPYPMTESPPFDEGISPYSDPVVLSSLSSPSIEDTEGLSVNGYQSTTHSSGIGLHQSISTNSLISANESLIFQSPDHFDPVYDANLNANTPDLRNYSSPMIQNRHLRHPKHYHEPAGFKCGWVGCKLIGRFGSEASLIRHIRSVHISSDSFKCPDTSCRMVFKRREELSHHIRRRHRGPRVSKSALGMRSTSQGQIL